jgi:hypothetical protein
VIRPMNFKSQFMHDQVSHAMGGLASWLQN